MKRTDGSIEKEYKFALKNLEDRKRRIEKWLEKVKEIEEYMAEYKDGGYFLYWINETVIDIYLNIRADALTPTDVFNKLIEDLSNKFNTVFNIQATSKDSVYYVAVIGYSDYDNINIWVHTPQSISDTCSVVEKEVTKTELIVECK